MSSVVVIATLDLATRWELDHVTDAGRKTSVEIPKHPVETGALIQQHAVDASDSLKCSGVITFTPVLGIPGIARAETMTDALRAVQAAHQPVWWFGPTYNGLALLQDVDANYATTDGGCFKVAVTGSRYNAVAAATTKMPPSKLKPAVRPGTAEGAGGASKKKYTSVTHKLGFKSP